MKGLKGNTPHKDGIARRLRMKEEEESWQEGDQMAEQGEEEQHLEDILKEEEWKEAL